MAPSGTTPISPGARTCPSTASPCNRLKDAQGADQEVCGAACDRWVTLDVSGTPYRTLAATLSGTPSLLQLSVPPHTHTDVRPPPPIQVDVDARAFGHILDHLRYGHLEQDLPASTLHSIARAARRLGMRELAVEAKYIYPLRQMKRRSRHTQAFGRDYYRFVRERWIFAEPAERMALGPKVAKAMDVPRQPRQLQEGDTERHTQAMLARGTQVAYLLGALDFTEHLARTGHIEAADQELNLLVPYLLALSPGGAKAQQLGDTLTQEEHDAAGPRPFFALCALAYARIDQAAALSAGCDLSIGPQEHAVRAVVAAIAGHPFARRSLHGSKLMVAAHLTSGRLPVKHIRLLAQEARQRRLAPGNLALVMLRHELAEGRMVFDRHLIELVSWSNLTSICAHPEASSLCASLIAMFYLWRADTPRAERWIRRWLHDARRPSKTQEQEMMLRSWRGLTLLGQKLHRPYPLADVARDVMGQAVALPTRWQRLRAYLFGQPHGL